MSSVFDGVPQLSHMDVGPALSQYVRGNQLAMQEEQFKAQRDEQIGKIVSQGAISADTPEKWAQFVGVLQKRFPGKDISAYTDFSARQPMVDQLRNYASERSDDRADSRQDKALANSNARADRSYELDKRRVDIAERAASGRERPPAGYRWKDDGGLEAIPGGPAAAGKTANAPLGYRWNTDNSALEPIPGGPAEKLPAELAARVGMADEFISQLPQLEKDIAKGAATGPLDFAQGKVGWGRSGEIHRRVASGADALQRMLTGAGMNLAEAAEYTNRYRPAATDTAEILSDKVRQLKAELTTIQSSVMRGRGGSSAPPPAAGNQGAGSTPTGTAGGAPPVMTGAGSAAPVQGARQAPDGNWYVPDPSRPGKYLQVR